MALPFGRIILAAFCLTLSGIVSAQVPVGDLRNDYSFFQKKTKEYQQWLADSQLDRYFIADSLVVQSDKVTLCLRPASQGPDKCAQTQQVWEMLQQKNLQEYGQYFHERLLHKWAFLSEVHENQAEILIRCEKPGYFEVRISSQNGRMPVEGMTMRAPAFASIQVPSSLDGANVGDNQALIRNKSVAVVTRAARKYLKMYYSNKGTPILWNARIDDTYTFIDEFLLEVTHLSHEICPDGYYEYHRIYVKGTQKGPNVELSWDFQGKYGSGILFPPRKNDYKDLSAKYKTELEDYQKILFRKLLDYLSR